MVLEQLQPHQPQLAHDIGPVERLRRVVEDPEDTVVLVAQEQPQRLQPSDREVLSLVDDDRVVAGIVIPVDGRVQSARAASR